MRGSSQPSIQPPGQCDRGRLREKRGQSKAVTILLGICLVTFSSVRIRARGAPLRYECPEHNPRAADVDDLLQRLDPAEENPLGIVLKIETVTAFDSLPQILLEAMRWGNIGVVLARGDLAVEAGFERLAERQEEILWLSEAAHAPVIRATEVLTDILHRMQDHMAKKLSLLRRLTAWDLDGASVATAPSTSNEIDSDARIATRYSPAKPR